MVMANDRWQQIKEVFHSALERDARERPAFLAEACASDESLRREVESLIASHEKEGTFLDSPAFELAADWLADENTDSLVGQQVNHYKILETIGAGGMGEVYLAQDTRLGRKIALKLLPASFKNDADRLQRFQQEARAASALNHPNILTIHEVGEQQGRPYIATELIEGETLRQRLAVGRMETDAALDIIMQTASALIAAHEVGIIHRDIKPENIMLRRDGYVKVVDFGLAKLAEPKAATARSDAEAPTRMRGNTTPGMVMGTVNYMSPEQARGLAVDERTDIWSLGVVFYEMLSGHAPFQGATPTDVTVAILEREPAPLTALSADVPAELDWIAKKALRKDREERYQTVKELLGDLRGVKQELEFEAKRERTATPGQHISDAEVPLKKSMGAGMSATTDRSAAISTDEIKGAQHSSVETLSPQSRHNRTPILAALALLVLALGGFAFYKFFLQGQRVLPFQAMNITRLTNHGKAIDAAISPDGNYFVYVLSDAGRQSLWLRQISATKDTQIVAPAPVGYFGVTFSRDGNNLYYVLKANDPGTLYRIPTLGGTPVKLLEGIDSVISFSPDGKRFAFVRGDYPNRGESGLFIANADGSNLRQLAARKLPELFAPIFFTGPSWSSDGQLVACPLTNTNSEGRIIAVRVEDGQEQVLTPQSWPLIGRVEWLPDMSGLLMTAREQNSTVPQIWHLSYPDGEARKVTNDLSIYRGLSLAMDASRMASIQISGLMNIWVLTKADAERAIKSQPAQGNREGSVEESDNAVQLPVGNVGYLGGNEGLSWTPDDRIVFVNGTGKRGDIWIMNRDGSNRNQLTFDVGNNHNPAVSPDGRYIVFTSDRTGPRNIWRMNIDGSNAQRLTDGLSDFLPSITPDGQWIIYSSVNSGRATLWKVPLMGGAPVEIINRGAVNGVVSPDGKHLAYLLSESGSQGAPPNRLAVASFEGGEPVKTFEISPGLGGARTILRWSRDGRSLLYTAINNNVSNIWSQSIDGGQPVQLTNFKGDIITAFDWSRDGRQLAVTRGLLIRDAVMISHAK